jgi:hypothetical protein
MEEEQDLSLAGQGLSMAGGQGLSTPSSDYQLSTDELLSTFKLLFEGQTRKFTSINFLTQLCSSNGPQNQNRPPISDILEGVQVILKEKPSIHDITNKLMPLSNDLQELSSKSTPSE